MQQQLAHRNDGQRTVNGTEHPIVSLLVRDQIPGKKPTWQIVHGLCNGVPARVETYRTKAAAVNDWHDLVA